MPAGSLGSLAAKLPLPPGSMTTLYRDDARFVKAYRTEFPGYHSLGDAGVLDTDGYISVMARTDDVINVAGHRLSTGSLEEVIAAMREARVPAGPILRARDLLEDEQFLARKMFERASPPPPASKRASSSPPGAEASSGESSLSFTLPAIVPVLSRTAGSTLWAGPELGAHTEEVLMEEGGFSKEEVEELRASGAVL